MSKSVLSNTLYHTEFPRIAFRKIMMMMTMMTMKTKTLALDRLENLSVNWFKCVLGSTRLPPGVTFLDITPSSLFASGVLGVYFCHLAAFSTAFLWCSVAFRQKSPLCSKNPFSAGSKASTSF